MNKVLEMTPEEFSAAVQEKVNEVLSSKEEAQARQEAEEALAEAKSTFEKLRAALEAKDAKIAEYEEALANIDNYNPSEGEVTANERVVELEELVENYKHRAEVAEAALDTLAREETAASRMSELEEAGVALEDEEAERQYAKVRDLSDEDFESYKSELIALRSKYASSSAEAGEDSEVAELSDEEVRRWLKYLERGRLLLIPKRKQKKPRKLERMPRKRKWRSRRKKRLLYEVPSPLVRLSASLWIRKLGSIPISEIRLPKHGKSTTLQGVVKLNPNKEDMRHGIHSTRPRSPESVPCT